LYFRDLVARGYLQQTEDEFPKLKLTARSEDVLKGRATVQLVKAKVLQAAKPDYKTAAELTYEKDLYGSLKELRKMIADTENVPAYIVLGDATLIELAAYLPQNLAEIRKISGFGDVKVQKYGNTFLDSILAYCKRKNLSSRISLKQPKREKKSHKPIRTATGEYKNTYQITLDMHRQGLSLKEIAEQRTMSVSTVAGHLAQFVEQGDLKAEEFVPREKLNTVRNLIDKHGYLSLKSIKDEAGDGVTYDDIRFVVSEIKGAGSV
jgi:ATP-dependent DNA helicase RecQ